MADRQKTTIYMCSWCGATQLRAAYQGRPEPGNCPRKPPMRNGNPKPHTWVVHIAVFPGQQGRNSRPVRAIIDGQQAA